MKNTPSAKPTLLDVDERIKAEIAHPASEEIFQNVFDHSVVAQSITYINSSMHANRAFYQLLGYEKEDRSQINRPDITHPDDVEMSQKYIDQLLSGEADSARFTKRYIKKDGSIVWVDMHTVLLKDASGKPLYYISTAIDITERKQAEEALRRKTALLEAQLNSTLDGIIVVDNDGKKILQNKRTVELWKIPQHIADDPDDSAQIRHVMHSTKNPTQFVEKITHLYKHPNETSHDLVELTDGTVLERYSAPVIGDNDRNYGRIWTFHDVTKSKKAEETLRESEIKQSVMVANISDVIAIMDINGIVRYKSPNIEKWFGWKPEDLIGTDGWATVHPDDVERIQKEFFALLQKDDVVKTVDYRYKCKDESFKHIELTAKNLMSDPVIGGVLMNYHDISERRLAEEALQMSEQKYSSLFNAMLEGFALHEIICDDGGNPVDYRFLDMNPAFERLTGLVKSDVIGKTVLNIMPSIESYWIERYGHVALTGEPVYFENFAAELKKHFEVTAFRPAPGRFACIFVDITERKNAEEEKAKLEAQLQQAQKMESVGRLAGGVAHDFNNMLSVILGHVELAKDKLDPDRAILDDIEAIEKAARRSADLTRQLLAFARKQTVQPQVLDLNQTVEGMLKMLRRLIGEDIDLEWQPNLKLHPVNVDPSQINQILVNLCINARDAIGDVGKITIETGNKTFDREYCALHPGYIEGEYVQVIVSDNGCGMDKETKVHLFEPFFTTKEVGKGTGLGLATVFGIVKQNNGFINVYSEPGNGTTFKIYLPMHSGEMGHTVSVAARAAVRGSDVILLVEDEPSILNMTKMMLEGRGYTVVAAGTPGEAVRLAAEHPSEINLLITDVVMPEMNGRDLAKNLLTIYPRMKRLFMSGYTSNVIAHHGVLDKGVHFIEKPFSRADLDAKVREALDG
jgi:PAS domain S-box-containing protein